MIAFNFRKIDDIEIFLSNYLEERGDANIKQLLEYCEKAKVGKEHLSMFCKKSNSELSKYLKENK